MRWFYISNKHEAIWTVGFYKPDGKWEPESDHSTPEAAAERVHYLNGGEENPYLLSGDELNRTEQRRKS